MRLRDLVERLVAIEDKVGNLPVVLFDDTSNEVCDLETVAYLKPTDYHGAVLDLDDPSVVLLAWSWDDEDESPD